MADWTYDPRSAWRSWVCLVDEVRWWPDATLPGALELRVTLDTKDSCHPENRALVGHRKPLPEHVYRAGPELMEVHLRRVLREVAQHEADEWLVIAGRRPFDPHASRVATHG